MLKYTQRRLLFPFLLTKKGFSFRRKGTRIVDPDVHLVDWSFDRFLVPEV